jgi:hypothetical protein
MKKITKIIALIAAMFVSCSPDNFDLGETSIKSEDLVENIAFKIEHDASNPNIVHLISLLDKKFTPLWSHPQGRSQKQEVILKMPFPGTYEVKFGVETPGGVIYGEPTTFEIEEFYADFVNDEMWTLLTGGVGESKTWIHDNGGYGLASGEVDYADPATVVEYNNFTVNWGPGKGHTGDDNIWGSTMIFSLDGGAFVDIHNESSGATDESGTFMLNTDAKTLTFTDAKIMHTQSWDYKTTNWNSGLKILTLTENQLQIAVFREEISGEGEWWMIWNYVAKDYADNYDVQVQEPEPSLPNGWQNDISQTVTTAIKWALSPETPFNWANLDGSFMNAWNSLADYPDWSGFNAGIPATYANFSITLDSDDNSAVYISKEGNEYTGKYSLDEKGIYTFEDIKPSFTICGSISLQTSPDNKWRITKIEKNAAGRVSGMWVGVRDAVKDEYIVFHLIPQAGTSAEDPLKIWKTALAGKTFKPDVNWFIDWVGLPPEFSGGWTSPDTFGDKTDNTWVWDANVKAVAESATLKFEANGDKLELTLKQKREGVDITVTGEVTIDPVHSILNINIPLVDYAGTVADWIGALNDKSPTGDVHDWYFVSHGGSNLSNIDTEGFWLGRIQDENSESIIFHYILTE